MWSQSKLPEGAGTGRPNRGLFSLLIISCHGCPFPLVASLLVLVDQELHRLRDKLGMYEITRGLRCARANSSRSSPRSLRPASSVLRVSLMVDGLLQLSISWAASVRAEGFAHGALLLHLSLLFPPPPQASRCASPPTPLPSQLSHRRRRLLRPTPRTPVLHDRPRLRRRGRRPVRRVSRPFPAVGQQRCPALRLCLASLRRNVRTPAAADAEISAVGAPDIARVSFPAPLPSPQITWEPSYGASLGFVSMMLGSTTAHPSGTLILKSSDFSIFARATALAQVHLRRGREDVVEEPVQRESAGTVRDVAYKQRQELQEDGLILVFLLGRIFRRLQGSSTRTD